MITAPKVFDLVFESDKGTELRGNQVYRWHSQGAAWFESQHGPKFIPNGVNHHPALEFDNSPLELFKFAREKGPHTFLMVVKPQKGILFDSQIGGTVKLPDRRWHIAEIVIDSDKALNGSTMLGSDYHGKAEFFKGRLAFFAYKNGMLSPAQRAHQYQLLGKKYNISADIREEWVIRIPVPEWLKRFL